VGAGAAGGAAQIQGVDAGVTEIDYDRAVEGFLSSSFDPHGWFVYLLQGASGAPLYVGRSANVLGRLGDHMRDPRRREQIKTVAVFRQFSQQEMEQTEAELIRLHEPPWNKAGLEWRSA